MLFNKFDQCVPCSRSVYEPAHTAHKTPTEGHSIKKTSAPPVTTTVLLQAQASMIQMVSRLKTKESEMTPMIRAPIRWGLLFGMLVVDGMGYVLRLETPPCDHPPLDDPIVLVKGKSESVRNTHRKDRQSYTPSSSRSSSTSSKHRPSVRRVTAQRDLATASSSSGPVHRLCRQTSLTSVSDKSTTRSAPRQFH
ncbi:hypothetical protein BC941DRAFT_511747 [Chlamydoabsidia padenii]|nr:hypothetical protein BC941DRAFT_511747 [Chlamydoabsidia padenii]